MRRLITFAVVVMPPGARLAPQQAPAPASTPAPAAPAPTAHLRPASPSHPHVEPGSAEDVRPGAGTGVRLQPRGRDPLVRARSRAGSVAADAPLGQGVGARSELQPRHRRRTRESGVRLVVERRSRSRPRRPSSEKAYVDALAARYSANLKTDRAALARAFSQAMGDLSRRYPDDLDAAVIYAESLMNLTPWKLWTPDGSPAANTEKIVSVLEWVLLRNPNHLGANHYYIHAVEASSTPARALPSAQRLRRSRGVVRASAPHAGAHICAHRRPCQGGGSKRGRRRGRSPLSRRARRRTGCTE